MKSESAESLGSNLTFSPLIPRFVTGARGFKVKSVKLLDKHSINTKTEYYISYLRFHISDIKFQILDLYGFDIPELWENVHETRLHTKVLLKVEGEEQ